MWNIVYNVSQRILCNPHRNNAWDKIRIKYGKYFVITYEITLTLIVFNFVFVFYIFI